MDVITLAMAKKYTDETAIGGGAIKGKNCTIQSINDIEGGHRVTFKWTLDDGTVKTNTMDVMDGIDGVKGDKGDTGEQGIQGEKGDTGEQGIQGDKGDPGDDGVGILTITFKEKDASGNNVYTITLTDNSTYDFTAPKGDKGDPGSGGDSALTTDIVTNTTVGAIPSGTTLAEGTTFTEFVQALTIAELSPTVNFTISKSGNVEYGESYTETLTVSVTNMGSAKKINTISWYEGNTLIQTDTIDSSTTGSWTHTMATATTDTTTFKAIVSYKKSDNTDITTTKTASINFYYKKFYGSVASLTPSEATVEALTSALATAKGGTYKFTTSAARIAYAYPTSLGTLTSIKDGNGFSLFDSFTRTTQTYTQNGTSVDYYLYVLTDATTVTNYSVIFA